MRVMGRQRFLELMEADELQHRVSGITDEIDVTSLRDYMQLTAVTDNMAASLGGRDNGWRPLQPEGALHRPPPSMFVPCFVTP